MGTQRVYDGFRPGAGAVRIQARRELLGTVVALLECERPCYVPLSRGLVLAYSRPSSGRGRLVASRKGSRPSDREDAIILEMLKKGLVKLDRRLLNGISMEPGLSMSNRSGVYGMTVFSWFEVEQKRLF